MSALSLIRPCTAQDAPLPVAGADEILMATEPGKARACNLAAARASGDILLFVDADTTIEGAPLEWYRSRPAAEDFWVSPSRSVAFGLWGRAGNAFFNVANRTPLLRRYPWAHGALIAVRAVTFREVGGFDEAAPMEDINLFARLWKSGYRHAKSPVRTVQYRAISFPPRRMNVIRDGHSGGYLSPRMK